MKGRKIYLWAMAGLCVLLCAVLIAGAAGIYADGMRARAADPQAPIYTREKAGEALGRTLPLIVALCVLTAVGLALHIRADRTEGPLIGQDAGQPLNKKSPGKARAALLAVSAALILYGVLNGGMLDVLGKAIQICSECVGLG